MIYRASQVCVPFRVVGMYLNTEEDGAAVHPEEEHPLNPVVLDRPELVASTALRIRNVPVTFANEESGDFVCFDAAVFEHGVEDGLGILRAFNDRAWLHERARVSAGVPLSRG